jgi:hypothetical protein
MIKNFLLKIIVLSTFILSIVILGFLFYPSFFVYSVTSPNPYNPYVILNVTNLPYHLTKVPITANDSRFSGETNYTRIATTTVSLSLTAPLSFQGYKFDSWEGCDSVQINVCNIKLVPTVGEFLKVRTVRVLYKGLVTLNVASSPITKVPITVNDSRFSGETNYTKSLESTTTVSLSLTAPLSFQGYNFSNWEGCNSTQINVCNVFILPGYGKSVKANYSKPIVVPPPSEASIAVRSSPLTGVSITAGNNYFSGITNYFRSSRSNIFTFLTAPSIVKLLGKEYKFVNWKGDCYSTSGGTCYINIRVGEAKSVEAVYLETSPSPLPVFLNVLSVQSFPIKNVKITAGDSKFSGITNYEKVSSSSISTLLVAPLGIQGYKFNKWQGCNSTEDNICNIEIDDGIKRTVLAQYDELKAILNVESLPIKGINITSNDPRFNGVTDYSRFSTSAISVSLTAPLNSSSPYSGYEFIGWGGCDSVRDNVCKVSVNFNESKKVIAAYYPKGKSCISTPTDDNSSINQPNQPKPEEYYFPNFYDKFFKYLMAKFH